MSNEFSLSTSILFSRVKSINVYTIHTYFTLLTKFKRFTINYVFKQHKNKIDIVRQINKNYLKSSGAEHIFLWGGLPLYLIRVAL